MLVMMAARQQRGLFAPFLARDRAGRRAEPAFEGGRLAVAQSAEIGEAVDAGVVEPGLVGMADAADQREVVAPARSGGGNRTGGGGADRRLWRSSSAMRVRAAASRS